jgi:predicted DNA binding CopG/RHH family protein
MLKRLEDASFQPVTCTGKREAFISRTKKIPAFKTEAEERDFWEQHDSSDYLDWKNAQSVSMPNLKPSTKTISLRLPEGLPESIKIEANKRDVPYQSLIKVWLADDVKQSRNR